MKKIRLNDPCPCGSGEKYKSCCFKKQETDETKFALGLITGIDTLEEFDEYVAPLRTAFTLLGAADELVIQIAMDCIRAAQTAKNRRQTTIDDLTKKYKAPAQEAGIDMATLSEGIRMMITRYEKFFPKEKKK